VLAPARPHGASHAPDLVRALRERILVLDGATGTWVQAQDLAAADFGGADLEGCNEALVLSRPDVVRRMHREYLAAGADLVETNSFGATPLVLAEYGLADRARAINEAAARLARAEADAAATEDRPRWVAGSMGPTTRTLSVVGGVTFAELRATYCEQALGLIEGGVDLLLVETCQDTANVKAALRGIDDAERELGVVVPRALSCTIEQTGTMLAGQDVEAFWVSVAHARPLFVGLNCSTGPDFMTDHLRTLAGLASCPVSCYPNAGLPDEDGHYHESPEAVAARLREFVERGWLAVVGGCCGTTADHVRRLAAAVAGLSPGVRTPRRTAAVAGLEAAFFEPESRPLLVGERTNVIGSRRFKRLVAEADWEAAAEIGRQQVKGGAQVVDVCLADPDRDEKADVASLLSRLNRKVKAPIMVDTTDADVLEAALELCQGKCIVNSINLEDGTRRIDEVAPLLRAFGGAVVVGCIDEDPVQGMAVTAERKLAVARRAHDLLTGSHGLDPRDLIFDPLVFPAGTGDAAYRGSAAETIEGVRLIKEALPGTHVILGISNVSFGLPPAAREVVNSVFLYHCTKAGLDLAIVNTERVQRFASIPEEERRLAEDLLFDRGDDPVAAIVRHFGARRTEPRTSPLLDLPLDERIARHVVEGVGDGVIDALAEARRDREPLEIINGPLMAGMDEVGRLFNDNELIVAEVLQSAEVMKTAVTWLEQFMEKADTHARGKLLLATVKGDVHDIGKNLVEIVLANNGYQVINLGIKVLPETLVRAAREHSPDAIGLSGLLVKSAREMVTTARDLADAGVDVPVLVGGAALSRRFTLTRIAPEYRGPVLYCKDATDGLDVMNRLRDPAAREALLARLAEQRAEAQAAPAPARPAAAPAPPPGGRSPAVRRDVAILRPPDLKRHLAEDVDFGEVQPWLNEQVLYGRHLGLRGVVSRLLEEGDGKALALRAKVEDLVGRATARGLLRVRAAWRFFAAVADGDAIALLDRPGGGELARFVFPRQAAADRLCLADYVLSEDPAVPDFVAAFVTTCGDGVREEAEALKHRGELFDSHALQAVALEGAEAAAEWLHARLRRAWGFPDPPGLDRRDVFKARYRGLRVSFGYPACPNLDDQRPLFDVLRPEDIGVALTEGFMMDPEASVSALVFHHPEARYFSALGPEDDQPAG
jgi:5-methyltetrahydrofolate--homocysteine methyltransferase